MAVVGDVFGLNAVYGRQIEDVENNNYASWPEIGFSPLRGYLAGGSNSPTLNSGNSCLIQRIDYSTDSTAFFPSSLSIRRSRFGSWATPNYAWFQGDQTNGHSSQDRLDYSTETMSQPGVNTPSNGGWGLFGTAQTPSIGYMAGGRSTAYKSGVVKFTFSTETFTFNPVGSLNVQNAGNSGLNKSNGSYGYFGGGYYPPQPGTFGTICAINRIQFSNETVSNITTASNKRFHLNQRSFQRATTQDSTYGYWAGGQKDPPPSANFIDEIDRFNFSTETFDAPGHPIGLGWKTMPADASPAFKGKTAVAGASSGSNAYWVGGYDFGGVVSNVHKMDFSTGTFTNPGSLGNGIQGAVLTDSQTVTARNPLREKGYKSYGYFGGGYAYPFLYKTIDRVDFSNETTSAPGNNLPVTQYHGAATSSNSYGYFGGGVPGPGLLSSIFRIDFVSETVSTPGNNLTVARRYLSANSSSSYGYFGGGDPSPTGIIDRVDFSNETTSAPGNNLTQARYSLAATSSNSYGYFAGGRTPSTVATIDRIDFFNETTSAPGNNLPEARYKLAATSSNSYGYFGGGFGSTNDVATVDRIDFSNETTSAPGNNLTVARQGLAAVSSSFYGYFGGGNPISPPSTSTVSTIDRVDFSNETTSAPGNNLPLSRRDLSAVSNSN